MTQAPATPSLVERLRSYYPPICQEAADALEAQQARIAELEAESAALTKALTGLTCSGSEFFIRKGDRYVADIDACVSWVRRTKEDAHRRAIKAITEQKASQALADRYEKALRPFVDALASFNAERWDDETKIAIELPTTKRVRPMSYVRVSDLLLARQALSSQGRREGGGTDPDFKVWSERRAGGVEWLGYTQPQVMEWLADQSRRYSGPDNRFGRALSALLPSPNHTNPEAEHG